MAAEDVAAGAAEEAANAVHDPGEMIGLWWARMADPETLNRMFSSLMSVAFVVLVTVVAYMGVMMLFRRAIIRMEREAEQTNQARRRRSQRIVTVLALVRSIAKWVIFIAGGVWALAVLGLNIGPVLAGAGILGLAVGFGAQNLVRDLVSGFFLLLEGQYAVGDYVQVGALFGMVESIGMRVTVLLDLDNQRHYIPNGGISTVTVYEEPFVNHIVEVPLAQSDDAESVAVMATEIAEELKRQYPHYLVYHGEGYVVPGAHEPLVRIAAAGFPTQEWIVTEELTKRVRLALSEKQIALKEGMDVHAYMDLSRMPIYNVDTNEVLLGGGE
ncbi:MAG: mechanosensitive ion channel [Armatimonadetes bacterium]|nr:mechanosensitive ion channel [Armatimonadota bacterium]